MMYYTEIPTLSDDQILGDMPAGAIQDKDDQTVRPGPDRAGKGGQDLAEHRRVRRIGQEPHHLSGGRTDEAIDIEPGKAMMSDRQRPLAPACPDPAQHRLEPGAMLVERPHLHRPARIFPRQLVHAGAEAGLEPFLGGKVPLGMTRTRHLTGEAEAAQVGEPAAWRDQAIDQAADPLRDPPTGPHAAIRRRMIQRAVKTLQVFAVEQRSGAGATHEAIEILELGTALAAATDLFLGKPKR
jgi:hypothetical protein